MCYRQQFRIYAEFCLRAAEVSNAREQKESLIATANAWHQLAQELEIRDALMGIGHATTQLPPGARAPQQATRLQRRR